MSGSSLSGTAPARVSQLGLRAPTAWAAACLFLRGAAVRAGMVAGRDCQQPQRRRGNRSAVGSSWQQQHGQETGPGRRGDRAVTGGPWCPWPLRGAAGARLCSQGGPGPCAGCPEGPEAGAGCSGQPLGAPGRSFQVSKHACK